MNAADLTFRRVKIELTLKQTETEGYPIWRATYGLKTVKCDQNHTHWIEQSIEHKNLDELVKLLKKELQNEIQN